MIGLNDRHVGEASGFFLRFPHRFELDVQRQHVVRQTGEENGVVASAAGGVDGQVDMFECFPDPAVINGIDILSQARSACPAMSSPGP